MYISRWYRGNKTLLRGTKTVSGHVSHDICVMLCPQERNQCSLHMPFFPKQCRNNTFVGNAYSGNGSRMNGGGGFKKEKKRKKKRACLLLHKQIPTRNHCVRYYRSRVRDCGVLYPGVAVNSDAKPDVQIQRKMPTTG